MIVVGVATVPVRAIQADAWTDYLLHCGGCHGLDGRGAPPNVPSLRDEPGRIIAVPGGRDYLIRVPGVAQSPLSDAALARVLNFLLTEFSASSLDASFVPYGADEVARHRKHILADPLGRRREIWRAY